MCCCSTLITSRFQRSIREQSLRLVTVQRSFMEFPGRQVPGDLTYRSSCTARDSKVLLWLPRTSLVPSTELQWSEMSAQSLKEITQRQLQPQQQFTLLPSAKRCRSIRWQTTRTPTAASLLRQQLLSSDSSFSPQTVRLLNSSSVPHHKKLFSCVAQQDYNSHFMTDKFTLNLEEEATSLPQMIKKPIWQRLSWERLTAIKRFSTGNGNANWRRMVWLNPASGKARPWGGFCLLWIDWCSWYICISKHRYI